MVFIKNYYLEKEKNKDEDTEVAMGGGSGMRVTNAILERFWISGCLGCGSHPTHSSTNVSLSATPLSNWLFLPSLKNSKSHVITDKII